MSANPWRTLQSRIAYENEWIRVREDRVIRPDGREGLYGVVEVGPSVGVVAINDREEVALVGQWRYPLGHYGWEIVRGSVDAGEDPLEAASRELREEAGCVARHWQRLGAVDVQSGVSSDVQHLYVATSLTHVAGEPEGTEDICVRWVPLVETVEMTLKGEIHEACSIAALLLAKRCRAAG